MINHNIMLYRSWCADGSVHNGSIASAVNDFVIAHSVQLSITWGEPAGMSWFILKPAKASRIVQPDSVTVNIRSFWAQASMDMMLFKKLKLNDLASLAHFAASGSNTVICSVFNFGFIDWAVVSLYTLLYARSYIPYSKIPAMHHRIGTLPCMFLGGAGGLLLLLAIHIHIAVAWSWVSCVMMLRIFLTSIYLKMEAYSVLQIITS